MTNAKGKIIIISGPSGSGKTTLHQAILQCPEFKGRVVKSVSATTRPPRSGEKNGRDYYFLSRKMFAYKIRSHHFLEWQKVFDNYYGTPRAEVLRLLNEGKHVLLCIDVKGAKVVLARFPEAVSIFIKTATLEDLKKRLRARETDNNESVQLRLKVAQKELKEAKRYEHIIINRRLPAAINELKEILGDRISA